MIRGCDAFWQHQRTDVTEQGIHMGQRDGALPQPYAGVTGITDQGILCKEE